MAWDPMQVDPNASIWAAVGGFFGRLLFFARADNRRWSWALVWEIPIAIVMGMLGMAIADYLNLKGNVAFGVIIGVSYVGPRVIDSILDLVLMKLRGTPAPGQKPGQSQK
jgi:hypothetical protein